MTIIISGNGCNAAITTSRFRLKGRESRQGDGSYINRSPAAASVITGRRDLGLRRWHQTTDLHVNSTIVAPRRHAIRRAPAAHSHLTLGLSSGNLPGGTASPGRHAPPCCVSDLPDEAATQPASLDSADPTAGALLEQRLPQCHQRQAAPAFHQAFKLYAPIGEGSYGKVHLCRRRGSGQQYAVKVLPKRSRRGNCRSRAIAEEVLLWSEMQRLCPQHVAPLEGVYEEGGSSYLVQELCRGGSLADHVAAHGPMRESDVRCVMRSLLEFLATCHAHGLLYGDVKASNLMLREPLTKGGGSGAPPDIRVVDFGCSRAMPGKDECLTRGVGTPLYMAPESIARCFGLPSDVWSAGVLMYFLLTGRFPFWEQPLEQLLRNQTLEGVQHDIYYQPIVFSGDIMHKLSPKALDLIGQLLTKDPASRITAQQALENPWFQHHQASSRRLPHSHAATAIGQPQQQEQQATD